MRNRLLIALGAVVVVGIGIWAISASGGDSDNESTAAGSDASTEGAEVTMWIMDNGPDPVGDTERRVRQPVDPRDRERGEL